ncbi:hypothetical protein [Streptomyces purpurascens]|uniref:Uncharacterized protein n=1 Tax=Streptomyces purpurascens TaxID=1924 RepID=A0ABZ1MAJ5_STREF|nr:hypothetical protein [Streptomyces purpurascens]GHA25839.1 hypothetical protein GCM10010303_40490 [Streptomyces purpurascens]
MQQQALNVVFAIDDVYVPGAVVTALGDAETYQVPARLVLLQKHE